MVPPSAKRWLHPQTVPRGFLRMYILTVLSRGSETGYSLMQKIEEKTDGAWRPGPGTMYPLLKSLVTDGLARPTGEGGKGRTKSYTLTPKGRRSLEQARRDFGGMGRKEPVMARLFSDLLPGEVMVRMMVNRYRDGAGVFREKLSQIPQPEKDSLLKELRLVMESQLAWIDSELASSSRQKLKGGARP
jgi:DNA-binding PadR family transcriptional regulator